MGRPIDEDDSWVSPNYYRRKLGLPELKEPIPPMPRYRGFKVSDFEHFMIKPSRREPLPTEGLVHHDFKMNPETDDVTWTSGLCKGMQILSCNLIGIHDAQVNADMNRLAQTINRWGKIERIAKSGDTYHFILRAVDDSGIGWGIRASAYDTWWVKKRTIPYGEIEEDRRLAVREEILEGLKFVKNTPQTDIETLSHTLSYGVMRSLEK